MTIGEAAAATGVSAKMIRYYEEIGLVPAAGRTAAGYRVYGPHDVHTLRFVRRARDLGFAVDRIAALLALWRDRSRASADVRRLAVDQAALLRRRIDELQSMVRTLEHLAEHCHGDARPDCPILDDLAATAGECHAAPDARFGSTGRPHRPSPKEMP
ncbi:Cu(I)-responsive transcriptional regulator [Allostella vacuolata]|nr:Cu(I)-responsive transcriptional regulator [Stella vacuolata]